MAYLEATTEAVRILRNLDVTGSLALGDSVTADAHTVSGSVGVTYSGTGAALTVNQQGTGKLFEVQDGGVARVTVLDGGNVGIRTVNPVEALHVQGNAFVQQSLIVQAGNTSGTINALYIDSAPAYAGNVFISNGYNNLTSSVESSFYGTCSILLSSAQNNFSYIAFNTGATNTAPTEKVRIALNGNVGIGTTSPLQKLHVVGNTRIQGDAIVTGNWEVQGTTTYMNTYTSVTSNVNINNVSGSGPALRVTQSGVGANYPIADFYDNDVSTTVPALRIADGGNVGIGTTDPLEKLHVVGNIQASGSTSAGTQFLGLAVDAVATPSFSWTDDTNTGMYKPGADMLGLVTAGVERVSVAANGNVGIGTTNPSVGLHLYNRDFRVDGIAPSLGLLETDGAIDGKNAYISQNGGTLVHYFANDANNISAQYFAVDRSGYEPTNIRLMTGQSIERLRITSTGNVGIGTTNPQQKLHVAGAIQSTETFTAQLSFTTSSTAYMYIGKFVVNDVIRLRITSTGHYRYSGSEYVISKMWGISSVPTINGSSSELYTTLEFGFSTANDTTYYIWFKQNTAAADASSSTYMVSVDSKTYVLEAAPVSPVISPLSVGIYGKSGNIGIGTNTSAYKLTIQDNSASPIQLRLNSVSSRAGLTLASGTNGAFNLQQNTNGDAIIENFANANTVIFQKQSGNITFHTTDNNTPRLTILNGGNVGIGTTNPLQKLDVFGSIAINGFKSLRYCIGHSRYTSGTISSTNSSFNTWIDTTIIPTYTRISSNSYIEVNSTIDGAIYFTSGYGTISSRIKCSNNSNANVVYSSISSYWSRNDAGYYESTAKLSPFAELNAAFCPANSTITLLLQYNVNIIVGTSRGGGINVWTSGPSIITIDEYIE
jgi:hypothetical protein